jgi:putative methionine-R-sulfoxide reductase with GAF domain
VTTPDLSSLTEFLASAPSGFGLPWWAWAATGGTLTALSASVTRRRNVRSRRRVAALEQDLDAAQARGRTMVEATLTPLADHLAALVAADIPQQRVELRGESIHRALRAAEALIDPRIARICWFELVNGQRRSLHPRAHSGRAAGPTTVFAEGTPAGDEVLAALDRGEARYCADVSATAPAGWDREAGRDYQAFVAVPVTSGTQCHGMLTLDSCDAADVTADDVAWLGLVARLLAAALSIEPAARTVVLPAARLASAGLGTRPGRPVPRQRTARHIVGPDAR